MWTCNLGTSVVAPNDRNDEIPTHGQSRYVCHLSGCTSRYLPSSGGRNVVGAWAGGTPGPAVPAGPDRPPAPALGPRRLRRLGPGRRPPTATPRAAGLSRPAAGPAGPSGRAVGPGSARVASLLGGFAARPRACRPGATAMRSLRFAPPSKAPAGGPGHALASGAPFGRLRYATPPPGHPPRRCPAATPSQQVYGLAGPPLCGAPSSASLRIKQGWLRSAPSPQHPTVGGPGLRRAWVAPPPRGLPPPDPRPGRAAPRPGPRGPTPNALTHLRASGVGPPQQLAAGLRPAPTSCPTATFHP